MSAPKKCHLIPPDEFRCVWMEAGLLSYQLCDRMFECDSCPLDAVMHGRIPQDAAVREAGDARPVPGRAGDIPREGFQYSRNHWWLQNTALGQVRLGIENGLARTLLAVKGVVFPSPRQQLQKGQACTWVVMDGGTLALEAPVDGVVRSVNHDLVDKPHILRQHPFDEGWLCELEPRHADGEALPLMTAQEASLAYASDQARFSASINSALRGRHPAVGMTLADGGEPLQNYADILGPARYIALLRQAFGRLKK